MLLTVEQVFSLVPLDTLKTIFNDIMALLPGNSLDSKALELPAAIIDQWIASCHGVINLQSITVVPKLFIYRFFFTVPDVACVLKLLDRLPHRPEIEVLHLPKIKGLCSSCDSTVCVLTVLDKALPALPKLGVLGLYHMILTVVNMHQVVQNSGLHQASVFTVLRLANRLNDLELPVCGCLSEHNRSRRAVRS